jgi:hypothetical protein
VAQRVTDAVQAAVSGRRGRVNLVLHAPAQHLRVEVGRSTPVRAASVIKLLILQARLARGPLTEKDASVARAMITRSDNAAATTLWAQAGGTAALRSAARQDGLTGTTSVPVMFQPWDGWQTTAADQIRVLDALLAASPPARGRTLDLMMQVEPEQAWGVGRAGAGTKAVAVKNGWLPLASDDWVINSDGCIAPGSAAPVCVAITSAGSPTMGYGIQTVTAAAKAAVAAARSFPNAAHG